MFQSLTFQKIGRLITSVDSQPMFDGGVLINVLGRLQVCYYSKPCLLSNLYDLLDKKELITFVIDR